MAIYDVADNAKNAIGSSGLKNRHENANDI